MPQELFDLAAKISVDPTHAAASLTALSAQAKTLAATFAALDAQVTKHSSTLRAHAAHTQNASSATTKLSEAFRALSSSAVIAEGPLAGTASRLRAMGTEASTLSGLFGPGGMIVGGLIALTGGAVALGVALFELAKQTADFGDSVFKAHEKTGFTIETISALKVAGHAVGVEIETMTTGLVRFENNLARAQTAGSKMNAVMSQMGVTAFRDPDKALSQFITHFAALRTDQDRTLAATSAFGLRFGANLVTVFNQVGGSLDEFKKRLRDMGLLITDDEAEAAHQFSVDLNELGFRIAGVGRIIGNELMPIARDAIDELSRLIDENRDKIVEWAGDFQAAAIGASFIASQISRIGEAVTALSGIPIPNVLTLLMSVSGVAGIFTGLTAIGRAVGGPFLGVTGGAGGPGGGRLPPPPPPPPPGGGRGRAEVDEGPRLLKQLQDELSRLTDKSKETAIAQELLGEKFKKTSAAMRDQIMAAARSVDSMKAQITTDKEEEKGFDALNNVIKEWNQQIEDARTGADKYDLAIRKILEGLHGQTPAMIASTKAMLENNAATLRAIELTRQRIVDLEKFKAMGLERGRVVTLDEILRRTYGIIPEAERTERPRRVTGLTEQMKSRIQETARYLTDTIDRAITEGFQGGIKKGLISLLQGLLDMIRNILLRALENQLTTLLSKIAVSIQGQQAGGGGGGWFSKLLGFLVPALLGGLGGGSAGPIPFPHGAPPGHVAIGPGRQAGGFIRPGQWGTVGEAGWEWAYGGSSGLTVVPQGAASSVVHNHYWNISTPNVQSFMGRDTETQITRRMARVMQKAVLK